MPLPRIRPTHYERLKVQPDAPTIVIRAAYRALAFRHHPDRRGPGAIPEDHEEMALLNMAYRILMDPAQRLRYDAELACQALPYSAQDPMVQPAPAQTSYPVAVVDAGPQTRVDLDWPDLGPKPSPQRISRREWKLVGALSLATLIGAGIVARQEHRRAEAEQALAARMSATQIPTPSANAHAQEADDSAEPATESVTETAARSPTLRAASSASQPREVSIAPDAMTFVLPSRRAVAEEEAASAAEATGGEQQTAAAAASGPAPAKTGDGKDAATDDPARLIERAPTAAGKASAPAASGGQGAGRMQPISHQLDGRPLLLKPAGRIPELQLGDEPPPALFR